ncbi:MAG: hypothetical protein WC906_01310 [Parcubacteria group bacterium]|jgi:hypothetical protein
MENVKLNFLHVCENASISREGKLSVIGIFNQIRFNRLPAVYPIFFIVVGLTGDEGVYSEEIQIISPDGEIAASVKNDNVEIKENGGSTNFLSSFAGFVFSKQGKYSIRVLVDGNPKDEITIEIVSK